LIEGGLVDCGWSGGPGDLADELEGGSTDLIRCGRGFEVVEGFYVSTHNSLPEKIYAPER